MTHEADSVHPPSPYPRSSSPREERAADFFLFGSWFTFDDILRVYDESPQRGRPDVLHPSWREHAASEPAVLRDRPYRGGDAPGSRHRHAGLGAVRRAQEEAEGG